MGLKWSDVTPRFVVLTRCMRLGTWQRKKASLAHGSAGPNTVVSLCSASLAGRHHTDWDEHRRRRPQCKRKARGARLTLPETTCVKRTKSLLHDPIHSSRWVLIYLCERSPQSPRQLSQIHIYSNHIQTISSGFAKYIVN